MRGWRGRALALLAAAMLSAPGLLLPLSPARASSELFKTSAGDASVDLVVRVPPGWNDSLAFTLPSVALVQGARFDISGSPSRLPAEVSDTGAGLLNASTVEALKFEAGSLRLADLPGGSVFSEWQGSAACGTAVNGGSLQLALDAGAMSFSPNARVFSSNQPEYDPALSVGPDDAVYIAWTDQSEYDFNIYLARSNDRGATFQPPMRINDNVTGKTRQESADLAAGPGGRVYVVWTDNRSGDEDIYIAASSDGGASFSRNRRVDDGPAGANASFPSVAVSASGSLAVAWEDGRAGDRDVRCAFSSDGASFCSSVRMNTDSSGRDQFRPRLAAGGGGQFHAVLYDNRSGDFDIYYARSSGGSFLPERRVDDTGDGGSFQALPAVAVGPDEYVNIVWHDRRHDGYRIMYSGSADGIIFSANLMISPASGVGKDQFQPRIRAGPGGTMHVSWHDRGDGYPHIRYTNFTSGAKSFGPAWRADDAPDDTLCYSPVPGVDSLGNVHLAWWDNRTRQGAFGTNFQIFHALGSNPRFPGGVYLSPAVDLGAAPSALAGASAVNDTPANTSLSVQLCTSAGDSGPWSGFFNLSAVGSPAGPPPARFVRWKVELGTREPTSTPSLGAVALSYLVHPASGALTSRPVTLPYAVRTAGVYWTEGRSGDGPASLAVELSSNNGSTWQEARPGLPFEFSGAGRVLVYRVRFSGSSSSTPTLSSVSLDLRMETYPTDVRFTMGRSAVTVWSLPGILGAAPQTSPDLREDFNRQVQEAYRASLQNATIRLNLTSATPGVVAVQNIRIAYDLPPVILSKEPSSSPSVEEGGALAFGVTAVDPDNDPLSSRWLLDGLQVETGALAFVYRPDHASSGVHNLTVVVSDGALSVSATWLVSVSDVNRPPQIRSTAPGDRLALRTGEQARFEVQAVDPDGSPLVYEWSAAGAPSGSNDRSFDYVAPRTPGVYAITVNISDGAASVNHTWTAEVYKPVDVPAPQKPLQAVQIAAGVLLALSAALAVALAVRRRPAAGRPARRRKRTSGRRGLSVKLKNGNLNQPKP